MENRYIVGMRVDATSYPGAASAVLEWARTGGSKMVCVANVHMAMEVYDSREFASVVNGADLVTADGVPLVWSLRMLGARGASRVYGPDLTLTVLEKAAAEGVAVGFYGSTAPVLERLSKCVKARFPAIQVAYMYAPPFRPLTADEDARVVASINDSGAKIVFIGLGCPKQERWMHSHLGRVNGVMLGVGAAFDFIAGTTPQAPRWMMAGGLEWLFRLCSEPRRLWKRYVVHNPRFVALMIRQLAVLRVSRIAA